MTDSVLKELRCQIIGAAAAAGEGHIASALSILDILWVLYDRIMRYDAHYPSAPDRDRFILSKGHASLGLYAVLAAKGFFPAAELKRFGHATSFLGGHPDRNKAPGVEASTGSLGHGLPMAIGVALALRIQKNDRHVYALVGDGECNEGTIWESALLACHHRLDNLTCIVDYNHSTDRALRIDDIRAKFAAFGWDATTVAGHDHDAIYASLTSRTPGRPTVVVAHTIKGYGCRAMMNDPSWHHRFPKPDELEAILAQVE